ncbi:MAG: ribbon-helix-helix protein, CopG family [Olsenella sp.]|nr:ribbon-helix-helix protein, CopG family [Olsenella sp.]
MTIAFKVPRSRRDELDRAAAVRNESRSEFLRDALDAALG